MNPEVSAAPSVDRDQLAINTLRFLAVDMVEAAGCGHPGAPMGQSALAYVLFTRHLRFDPKTPDWPNRDRFVLSCGHASALLYGLLHLSGYDLPLDQLRNFRQFGSRTAGHPEHGMAPGIETTTGPLGQGVGNAVGMAIAESLLAEQFNRDGFDLFDHRVWALASDGDLMEGVAAEACSYAGHLRLGKLNVIYDANEITIDGSTDLTFSEDVGARFAAYGWHTVNVDDGNDLEALDSAFAAAAAETDRPSLITVHTHIGYGSPNRQDTAKAHGEALGADEARATKVALGWPLEPTFRVPEEAYEAFAEAAERGAHEARRWQELRQRYRSAHAEPATELERRQSGELPGDLPSLLPLVAPEDGPIATRAASGKALNALREAESALTGGSADLTGSNKTLLDGVADYLPSAPARNLRFGVREHGMGAMLNGMALSGLLRPYGGTFLIFLGLHATLPSSRRIDGAAGHLCLHPRFDLSRRGRTDPPAGQPAAGATRYSQPLGDSARRRQRDFRCLGGCDRAEDPADSARPDPSETAGPGADGRARLSRESPGAPMSSAKKASRSPLCC